VPRPPVNAARGAQQGGRAALTAIIAVNAARGAQQGGRAALTAIIAVNAARAPDRAGRAALTADTPSSRGTRSLPQCKPFAEAGSPTASDASAAAPSVRR
jgi:hypothetical protein